MDKLEIIIGALGGLGLFLFGMRLMSEGLRKVAGERLKNILRLLTRTTFIAILVGAGVTALIQSSSATTVMVVGFVNAALLTLRQAIGVIMGANIGTTVTAWLVSFLAIFKVSNFALPAVAFGFGLTFLGKNRGVRFWGEVMLGFGLLFLGLSIMKDAFKPLHESGAVKALFVNFGRYPILGVMVGMLFTMLLQSSSATIAVVQMLAFNGALSFSAAIPLILGDNIGTTITAQIAAVGTSPNARRAAHAHTLFNVLGVCFMLPFIHNWGGNVSLYARAVDWLIPGRITAGNVMFHIAIAHSVFNIVNTMIFLPLIGLLERAVMWVVPRRPEEINLAPQYLEKHLLDTPPLALEQATREIVRMMKIAQGAISDAVGGFLEEDRNLLAGVAKKEEAVDNFQYEITRYLTELSQRGLDQKESEELPVLLHSVNDIERIGDHAENLVELAERKISQKLPFTHWAMAELKTMADEVNAMMNEVAEALLNGDASLARRALKREEHLNRLQIELRQNHIQRLGEGKCALLSGIVFIDFVDNLEKIGDHLTNIAQAVAGGLHWEKT